jgi:hypothetical protein|nr:MAG TPA: Catabolite control protein A [Caudoviricetes sp.]
MTGLQKEIEKRKHGKKSLPEEKFSIQYIAKLLGISYMAVMRKLKDNTFWGDEERAIFYSLIEREKQTLEMREYLFTEQKGEE